jgi:hypothetical protein
MKNKYVLYIDKKGDGKYLYSPGLMNEKKYKKWIKENPDVKIYKTDKYEE